MHINFKLFGWGATAITALVIGAEIIGHSYPTFPSASYLMRSFESRREAARIEDIQAAYKSFLTSATELKALEAAHEMFRLQNIILAEYSYTPKEFNKLCIACLTHELTTLAPNGKIHYTLAGLPPRLKELLAILGIKELVDTEVKHIFIVEDPQNYPEMFGPLKATTDSALRSIFIAVHDGVIDAPEIAAVIGHEAWHIRHNDEYPSNWMSESDAYKFEIRLLKVLLNQTLTPRESEVIMYRIKGLSVLQRFR